MNDIYEYIFKGLVAIVLFGITGWCGYIMLRITKNDDKIDQVEDMIKAHELEDARIYVGKTDFKETVVELKDTVKRMYDKMDAIMTAVNKNN